MANEATITSNLKIQLGNLDYRSLPSSFKADVTTAKGPVPGAFTASASGTGTAPDLSELTTPALVRITNLDTTNYVEVGLEIASAFEPLIEVQPGESYVYRFSRNLTVAELKIKANTASCVVVVEAFEL